MYVCMCVYVCKTVCGSFEESRESHECSKRQLKKETMLDSQVQ